jgi:hypothetical protein
LIDLKQYKTLCKAGDLILDSALDRDEIVSIPLLHVLREHPQCLKSYEFVFNRNINFKANSSNLFNKFLNLIKSTLFDSKLTNISPKQNKNIKRLVFVSHITNPSQCNNLEDEYFGSLPNDLLKFSNIEPIILLINQTSLSSRRLSKNLSTKKINKIVLPKSSGLFNELKIFFKLFLTVHSFTKSVNIKDSVALMLLNSIKRPSVFLSGMSALRIGFFVEKIVKVTDPKYIFTTYEGHARERIIFSSARKINKKIICFAYQHSILNKYHHSLTREIYKKYNPNHIFCCGKITNDFLSSLKSLEGSKISLLGSPKGLPINTKSKLTKKNRDFNFLFLPEGLESEYKIFFKFILDCALELPDSKFVWRSHPLLDLEKLDFFNNNDLPLNITISSNLFDEDLNSADIAIYRGTAAIIRAVQGNLIPVYLQRKDEIGLDIMHSLRLNRVLSVVDLKSTIKSSNLQFNLSETVKFCSDYFRPLDYKSLLKVLDKYDY